MEKVVRYPGSIGELVQGRMDGMDLLVSCPINLFSTVRIYETKEPINRFKYSKANKMFLNLLERWKLLGYASRLDFEIESEIPVGKGFASSTADLSGIYRGLVGLFNRECTDDELAMECLKIEPSDSIIFDRLTVFDYRNGKYKEALGEYLEFELLVFEGSRFIDTIEFNSKELPSLSDLTGPLRLLKKGITERKLLHIGEASTKSILNNQHRVRYECIDEVMKIMKATGGLGIIGGHSGDVLAIIYDDKDRLNFSFNKNKTALSEYKCYTLKTLRSIKYENYFDNCTL